MKLLYKLLFPLVLYSNIYGAESGAQKNEFIEYVNQMNASRSAGLPGYEKSNLFETPAVLMKSALVFCLPDELKQELEAFCADSENLVRKYDGESALQKVLPWGVHAASILINRGADKSDLSRPLFDGLTPLQKVMAAGTTKTSIMTIKALIALGAQEQTGA